MKVLLDTSVLVAAMVEGHPLHRPALEWMQRIHSGEVSGCVAAHSLAETYAVLTRLPVRPLITPAVARRLISENILQHMDVAALDSDDYIQLIDRLAERNLRGGITYDAMIALSAERAQVDVLVTGNGEHFRRAAPGFSDRLAELS